MPTFLIADRFTDRLKLFVQIFKVGGLYNPIGAVSNFQKFFLLDLPSNTNSNAMSFAILSWKNVKQISLNFWIAGLPGTRMNKTETHTNFAVLGKGNIKQSPVKGSEDMFHVYVKREQC